MQDDSPAVWRASATLDAADALPKTSLSKIVDNMIIAFVKEKGALADS